MDVVLYSTGCPRCKILKEKLDKSNISYQECTDIDYMTSIGLISVPVLSVDGGLKEYMDAVNWISNTRRF